MTPAVVLSTTPLNIAIIVALCVLGFWALIWYALRIKGDVRAAFSHGKTLFEIEAKERRADRK
jgi:hypothetical protein